MRHLAEVSWVARCGECRRQTADKWASRVEEDGRGSWRKKMDPMSFRKKAENEKAREFHLDLLGLFGRNDRSDESGDLDLTRTVLGAKVQADVQNAVFELRFQTIPVDAFGKLEMPLEFAVLDFGVAVPLA